MNDPKDREGASGEPFLSRWSRRKAEAREAPPAPAPAKPAAEEPPPTLPPLESLTPDSDFRVFFHPKVGEDVRRAALKKLFSDPRFNVMDGLDVYIDDYSKPDPIPPAMLATMRQAQAIFESARQDAEERERRLAQARAAGETGPPVAAPAPLTTKVDAALAPSGEAPDGPTKPDAADSTKA